jgi:mono/diheme cytochrome c family protein
MITSNPTKLIAAAALAALLAPAAALAGDAAAGKTTFQMFCATCHGQTGKGDGPVGAVLNPPPRDLSKGEFKFDTDGDGEKGTDADLMNVITNGAAKYGGSDQMAPWGGSISEGDRENLIAYIRTLKE